MKHTGYVPEPIAPDHYFLGSNKLTERFGAAVLMPGGRGWKDYLPAPEDQSNRYIEPEDCTIANALKAWETVANKLKADGVLRETDFPKNCSERFNAICADIGPQGASPFTSANSIASNGVIPENILPFNDKIRTWDEFYHPKPMTDDFKKLAESCTKYVNLQREWVFNDVSNQLPLSEKIQKIQTALERGVVCVSVYAWNDPVNGVYEKSINQMDEHWTLMYDQDGFSKIFDTYPPYFKDVFQNFQSAILYTMNRKTDEEIARETTLISLYRKLIDLLQQIIVVLKTGAWTK